jgi:hypothetical protein
LGLTGTQEGCGEVTTPSTCKIPATGGIPEHFKIDLWPEPNREDTLFGSKAVGEPPLVLANSVHEAIRDAVAPVHPSQRRVVSTAPAGVLLNSRTHLKCNFGNAIYACSHPVAWLQQALVAAGHADRWQGWRFDDECVH